MNMTSSFSKMNWPKTAYELEQEELERIASEMPDDHAAVLCAVMWPTTTPYINHLAEDSRQTFEHTRICLKNLKYQQLVHIKSYVEEDRSGYFGCFYSPTSLGRLVAHKLERAGRV